MSRSWKAGPCWRDWLPSRAASVWRPCATAVGYRNPAHLAKIAASVDLISRGRLTLGIGAGFFENEYRQYGWEFPPRPATRIRQMEEAVELILKLWTQPRTTFHGRYFHVEDAILEPKPVQKPRPPVMIAGGGEQMTLRAVARLGRRLQFSGGEPAEIKHKLDVLRRHCDAVQGAITTRSRRPISRSWLLARNDAAVAAKRELLPAREPLHGFVGTVPEAIDLIGQYQAAGIELLINGDLPERRGDPRAFRTPMSCRTSTEPAFRTAASPRRSAPARRCPAARPRRCRRARAPCRSPAAPARRAARCGRDGGSRCGPWRGAGGRPGGWRSASCQAASWRVARSRMWSGSCLRSAS